MDNLTDYVRWMGDYPISMTGFQDADAMVLCALSYFDFAPLLAEERTHYSVSDFQSVLERDAVRVMITGSDEGFRDLLQAVVDSKRFGELKIASYKDILQQDPPVQFSAVCFHGKGFSFLAFRGTDSSLAGWKEDFLISVKKTEAQELAVEYAEKNIKGRQKWYIGGHSKGGNLALYAACMLSAEKWAKVERMYLLDGPGFCPDVLNPENFEAVNARTRRFIPRFSVIGKLFEPNITDTRIVQSSARGFLQHSILSWGIDHGKPALAEENDPSSLWIHETMEEWIRDLTQEERILLIEDLFDSLAAGGADDLNELEAGDKEGREAILKRLSEMSASSKQSLSDLPKYALRARIQDFREKVEEGLVSRGLKREKKQEEEQDTTEQN